ncbi:EpsG family protein [uncultured Allofournierella sp.]|uniref:EpsG family protein n=1 Tax=uncultured Allofournierella sp. TaxID=1940258 RepID=UPI0025CC31B2|nr:EpsG family protein [uncultured Fournierella sp.]
MIYYIEIVFIVCLCCACTLFKKGIAWTKVFAILIFGATWLVLALRGSSVGADTQSYINYFWMIDEMSIPDLIGKINSPNRELMDVGFAIYVKVLSFLTNSPQIMLAISGGFYLYVVYIFAKYNKLVNPIYVLWYICLAPYLTAFNLVRQCVALGFCLLSWMKYNENKRKAYFLWIIAVLFHISAVVWAITFVAKKIKPSRKLFVAVFGLLVVLFFWGGKIIYYVLSFFPVYQYRYGQNGVYSDMTTQANGVVFLWIIIVLCAALVAFKTNWGQCLDSLKFEKIVYSLIAIAFFMLGNRIGGVQRIAVYFQPFWVPLLCDFGKMYEKKVELLYTIAVTVCAVAFFFLQIQSDQYSPYVFFWNNI